MAKATRIAPDLRIYGGTLTLSEIEVATLGVVLRQVGGAPNGPRAHVDSILKALDELAPGVSDDDVEWHVPHPFSIKVEGDVYLVHA